MLSGRVYFKSGNGPGMTRSGSVTVFTLDRFVRRNIQGRHVFGVTGHAVFPSLVFDREVLPFLDVTEAIVAVGEGLAVNAKIVGNEKYAHDQNRANHTDRYP